MKDKAEKIKELLKQISELVDDEFIEEADQIADNSLTFLKQDCDYWEEMMRTLICSD